MRNGHISIFIGFFACLLIQPSRIKVLEEKSAKPKRLLGARRQRSGRLEVGMAINGWAMYFKSDAEFMERPFRTFGHCELPHEKDSH